jgi:hypothetical protein
MAMWWRHRSLRSQVASVELNAVGSSPSGAVVAVCSSSIAIGSTVSSCRKKVIKPNGLLRFMPRFRVFDVATDDRPMSGPSG